MRRALAGLAFALALVAADARADISAPPALAGVGVSTAPLAQLPLDVPLVDQDGGRVTLGSYFDGTRPVILLIAYYHCPMLCPLDHMGVLHALQHSTWKPGRDLRLVSVSIDPHEGPADARRMRDEVAKVDTIGAADAWSFTTADPPAIRRLTDALAYRYRYVAAQDQYAHPAAAFAVTADGRVAKVIQAVDLESSELDGALAQAASGSAGSSLQTVLLQCFCYTPSLRRYAGFIAGMIKFGGALIFIATALVFLLGRMRRPDWERESS